MAQHFNCKCSERDKPVRDRAWYITQYKWNSGAFTAGNGEPSDYSTVHCARCSMVGRTKAKYVEDLKLVSIDELASIEKSLTVRE